VIPGGADRDQVEDDRTGTTVRPSSEPADDLYNTQEGTLPPHDYYMAWLVPWAAPPPDPEQQKLSGRMSRDRLLPVSRVLDLVAS